ncbi:glycoside hydrolase family 88 protein [Aestuariivivens insulae]|uniref:glycoside hydrolase family 88 protein n=1 Tax=Aestuariivivens insulae TaxID=1621988 RepID=UPI001F57D88C|nr:glycoside hydrolase family 88 protein [Aestuariivivens insulae]
MTKTRILFLCGLFVFSCNSLNDKTKETFVEKELVHVEKQMDVLLRKANTAHRIPRTVTSKNNIEWTNQDFDWTEGFFPGTCWYLYEETKDEKWKAAAEKMQSQFEVHKYLTTNHDLGFVFNCSYGNGYRITKDETFKQVMITAGNSLLTRFNPVIGCIQSWDVNSGWQAERGWNFPVIIDNMMNLELLFKLSEITGDHKYKKVAISHANTTLKNHFRQDNSSYHVVDYDSETGMVRSKQTAQGFADESSWARGQAWGLYGYTVCYRYTKDEKYLDQAQKIASYILNYKETPKDGIPFWDYNAPDKPNTYRDVSAAAVTVSALIELNQYSHVDYSHNIDKLLKSLASDKYMAKVGTNNGFLLKHSVGSLPHQSEIDVPLNYADYYFIEALIKYEGSHSN